MLAYLDSLESDDEGHNQFQEAESLEFVLVPPSDGQDRDQDDAPSDDEIAPSIGDLGKGLLAQKGELYTISKQREKRPVVCQSISLDKNTTNDESWDDSDNECLATKQKRLKLSKPRKNTNKKARSFKW
ncbi:hypothetical protein QE152_g21913 [Popillia japonica]|uniref:Uncharacterized protein n=1 Tax=Popillia japonica TaxID=7064 RepID=A0AAW1KM41_POPJA